MTARDAGGTARGEGDADGAGNAYQRILENAAREAMERRGHKSISRERIERLHITRLTCDACGREADANDRPMPNQIDIGGEAVAINCTALADEHCIDWVMGLLTDLIDREFDGLDGKQLDHDIEMADAAIDRLDGAVVVPRGMVGFLGSQLERAEDDFYNATGDPGNGFTQDDVDAYGKQMAALTALLER